MSKLLLAVYLLAVSVALLLILPSTGGAMQGQPELPNLPFYKVEVNVFNKATNEALRQMGAIELPTGGYTYLRLWKVPNKNISRLSTMSGVKLKPEYDQLYVNGIQFYPQLGEPPIPANLRQSRTDGHQLWLLFLNNPYQKQRLHDLLAEKNISTVKIAAGLQGLVVWATDVQIKELEALVGSDGLVGWTGAYHPYYRISRAELRNLVLDVTKAQTVVNVEVHLHNHPSVQSSLAKLKSLAAGGKIFIQWADHNTNSETVGYALPVTVASLLEIANWYDTALISPYSRKMENDELQGQIIANNYSGGSNSGQTYLNWLNSKGFSTAPVDYPVISIIDTGLHVGTTNPSDPDLYQIGQLVNGSRVTAISTCVANNTLYDKRGHGSFIASIIGGYNSLSGFPYRDSNNYQIGLGISPYGRLSAIKALEDDYGTENLVNCDNSYLTVLARSREQDARIVNSSIGGEGTDGYDLVARQYDLSVRTSLNGSTAIPLLHVISAGNNGLRSGSPNVNKISSPGTAKNGLTIGATYSPRDVNEPGGCNTLSSSDQDAIAPTSSIGATIDGRIKPDLVAPGRHIQGSASRYSDFNGAGICGSQGLRNIPPAPFSRFYPIVPMTQTQYTWASGTSFAAPAVAGAAQLTYNYYRRILKIGQEPSPAMVKALLINSARPLASTLPDSSSGWGMVNIGELFNYVAANTYVLDQSVTFTDTTENALPFYIRGRVVDPTKSLKVSLVWTDAPGAPGCSTETDPCLVNDLDLEVLMEGGSIYAGNNFSGQFSTSVGNYDRVNNVENVYVRSAEIPASRNFIVRITPRSLQGDGVPGNATPRDQDFALVIHNTDSVVQTGPPTTLVRQDVTVSDALGGNNDGFVDLNELVRIDIPLKNTGSEGAVAVSSEVTLTPGQNNVVMVDSRSDYSDIITGDTQINLIPFSFRVNSSFTCGQFINFNQRTVYNGGVITTSNFSLQTGAPALGTPITYSTNMARPLPQAQDLPAVITVPIAISSNVTGTIGKLRVRLNLTHPNNSELGVSLIGPPPNNVAQSLFLITARGANFTNTIFDDDALQAFSDGTGPYTGSFNLGFPPVLTSYIDEPLSGTWRLVVTNYDTANAGTLSGWDLLVQRKDARACVVYPPQTPASIVAQEGTPQSGAIGSQFNPLVALVVDNRDNPLPGVPVIFQAPQNGASGTFPGGAKSLTVNTNEDGLATAPIFTANNTPGTYTVTAKVSNIMTLTAANFDLTNVAGDANALTIVNGSRQGTALNTAFPAQLRVSVRDSAGNPVPNTGVTFIPPDARQNGVPGGSFGVTDPDPESNGITIQTDALGIAVAPEFTANGVPGTYNVIATTGLRSVSFSLTNVTACAGGINPYLVTSGTDDGSGITCGTLSRALLQATPGTTVIFASGVVSLTVSNSLPPIRGGVTLEGESCVNLVTLSGSGTSAALDGLKIEGGGIARFLVVRNFSGRQIVAAEGGNKLECVRALK